MDAAQKVSDYAAQQRAKKERAEEIKREREARKADLDQEAAQRKAAMEALRAGKPAPAEPIRSESQAPRHAPSSASAGNTGDSSELLQRIAQLEQQVADLKRQDAERQQERERLQKRVRELEQERFRDHKQLQQALANIAAGGGGGGGGAMAAAAEPVARPKPAPTASRLADTAEKSKTSSGREPMAVDDQPIGRPAAARVAPEVKAAAPLPTRKPVQAPLDDVPVGKKSAPQLDDMPVGKKAAPQQLDDLPVGRKAPVAMDDLPVGGGGGGGGGASMLDDMPVGGGGDGPEDDGEEVAGDPQDLVECSLCSRSFNKSAIVKHERICKKVFQTKRKAFKVEILDAEDKLQVPKGKKGAAEKAPPAKDPNAVPKWKKQRDQLQAALQAGRELQAAIASGADLSKLPPPKAAAPEDDDRIPCPHCKRKFASETAARHIPKCPSNKKK